jgi:U3 small nucleolar ribonucleoprotein protein IMP4
MPTTSVNMYLIIVVRTHIDDEYANTLYNDPQILMTTSRNPSNRLMQFLKEMAIIVPNAERINRGAYVMDDLVNLCLKKNLSDLVLLHEHRGQPDGLIICHLPVGPTVYFGLQNVVLRHDVNEKLATMPEIYPHLIFHNFSTTLGERVVNILKHLFPVPKVESKRVISFSNNDDLISFRHHTYEK